MSFATSPARRTALRLFAAVAVAATLAACDAPMAPVSSDAAIEANAPGLQNDVEPDSTGKSGWSNPNG